MTEEIIIAGFGGQGGAFDGEDSGIFRNYARPGSLVVSIVWARNAWWDSQRNRYFK